MVRPRGLLLMILLSAPAHALECPKWLARLGSLLFKPSPVTAPMAEAPAGSSPEPKEETFGLSATTRETLGQAYRELLDSLPGGRNGEVLDHMLATGDPFLGVYDGSQEVGTLRRDLGRLSRMVGELKWDRAGVDSFLLSQLRSWRADIETATRKAAVALLPEYSVEGRFINLQISHDSSYVWGLGKLHDLRQSKTSSVPLGLGPATVRGNFVYTADAGGTLTRYPLENGVPNMAAAEVFGEVNPGHDYLSRDIKESPDGRYLVVRLRYTRLRGNNAPDHLLVHDLASQQTFRTHLKSLAENYNPDHWGVVPTADGSLRLWEYESENRRVRIIKSVTPSGIKLDPVAFHWNLESGHGDGDLEPRKIHWGRNASRPVAYSGIVALVFSITAAEKKKGQRSEKVELLRPNEHRASQEILGSALHPTEPWLVLLKSDKQAGKQWLDYMNVDTREWGTVRPLRNDGHTKIHFTEDGHRLVVEKPDGFSLVTF